MPFPPSVDLGFHSIGYASRGIIHAAYVVSIFFHHYLFGTTATTGLVSGKVSLDAGHAYGETLRPIHDAGGVYVVQIKLNQPQLFETLAQIAAQAEQAEQVEQVKQVEQVEQVEQATQEGSPSPGVVMTTVEKGHGRLEERVGRLLSLDAGAIAERWESTGLQTLIAMDRFTEKLKTGDTSAGRSYYVSNQPLPGHEQELFDAIRGHWRIESAHWIRDVTFHEDHVRTKNPNVGQILSLLRTVAIKFLHHVHPPNVQAMLEKFADVPEALHDLLVRFNVVDAS